MRYFFIGNRGRSPANKNHLLDNREIIYRFMYHFPSRNCTLSNKNSNTSTPIKTL